MASRHWLNGNGDWFDQLQWSTDFDPNTYPIAGDTLDISSGTATISGAEATQDYTQNRNNGRLGPVELSLGGGSSNATLRVVNAYLTRGFDITDNASGSDSVTTFQAVGNVGFAGTIETSQTAGTTFALDATQPNDAQPGNFVLLRGGLVDDQSDLVVTGTVTDEAAIKVDQFGAHLTNNGTINLLGGTLTVGGSTTLDGTGTDIIGMNGTLDLEGQIATTQTIQFNGPGGRLIIGDTKDFNATITGFQKGDVIDLTDVSDARSAKYDATAGSISVDNGTDTYILPTSGGTTQSLYVQSDGSQGTYVEFPNQSAHQAYQIKEGDLAVRGDVARTLQTASGTPIDGRGIKIGIISDSFDVKATSTSDPALTDAKDGYLPYDAGSNTVAVNVLAEGPSGAEDEGRAMAELVHQTAPGAAIDFAAGGGSASGFVSAVQALVADGCSIIVDDLSFHTTPFYQVAGSVDGAVQSALAAGVDYFTSASNFGQAFFGATWNPTQTTLDDGSMVTAQNFDNGTCYQTIDVPANTKCRLDLQWDAPWSGSGPAELQVKAFDINNNVVTSSQVILAGPVPETELVLPTDTTDQQYRIAVYQPGGAPAPTQFKYVLFGGPATSSAIPGGTIDDPMAGVGSGDLHGQALVTGANVVAATYWANSPAFGQTPDWNEAFSSVGPGTLLFDQNGHRYTTPQAAGGVTFTAPDGITTPDAGFNSFYGTSAAAPVSAAVAALVLQANPNLTQAQVTSILKQSAITLNQPAAEQGAGLIQADAAVKLALGQSGPVTPPVTTTSALYLKPVPGSGQVQIWARAGTNLEDTDIVVHYGAAQGSYVSYAPATGWNDGINPGTPGTIQISTIDTTGNTPLGSATDAVVGTLTFAPVGGATDLTVSATVSDGEDTKSNPIAIGDAGTVDLPFQAALTGTVYDWKSHTELSGVQITAAGAAPATTDANGSFTISGLTPGQSALTLTRSTADIGNTITAADALAALKLAVGLNPNTVSAATGTAPLVSPYQLMAADVLGTGRITAADALAILKMAVHLGSAPTPRWIFASDSTDDWNAAANSFNANNHAVPPPAATVNGTPGGANGIVGVLLGDVNGRWTPPNNGNPVTVGAEPASYFATLSQSVGAPVDQWGIASYTAAGAVGAAPTATAPLSVVDSAAHVAGNIDGLETLAKAGHLAGIWLNDSGTPVLSLTAAQAQADKDAIAAIHGAYTPATTSAAASASAADPAQASAMLSGDTIPVLRVTGAPRFLDASVTPVLTCDLRPATGIVEASHFTYGADRLDLLFGATPPSALVTRDVTLDGSHAVYLASATDMAHGVVLAGLPTTATAADLLAHHVTLATAQASIG